MSMTKGENITHFGSHRAIFDELPSDFYYYISRIDDDAHQGQIPKNILMLSSNEPDFSKIIWLNLHLIMLL